MNNEVQDLVVRIVGKPCTRKHVGRSRSLSLGFGEPARKSETSGIIYREWELRTYYCAWRVVKGGRVLCGSQDVVDSIDELNQAINGIELGRFSSLQQVGEMDVRIELDNGCAVDFLATISDDDECFHIMCPEHICIVFSPAGGWQIGPSDRPWRSGDC
jgi:hypothetical protein